MQTFHPLITSLSDVFEMEVGTLPTDIAHDIQLLIAQCPNLAYCTDFLDFQRQCGGFLLYLDTGDLSLYSVNSPEVFPLLTGEGELITEEGFLCFADYCDYEGENIAASARAWGFKVDELPYNQAVYCKKGGKWEVAFTGFCEMLEAVLEEKLF